MDLYAYANIKNLEEVAKKNNIDCPRLRGYRLMSEEEPIQITKEDIKNWEYECAEYLCETIPCFSHSFCTEWSMRTRRLKKKYLDEEACKVHWGKIHGRKRKALKTEIHNTIKRFEKQTEVWNKYAGKENILYIHARIGGGNWPYYYKDVIDQPWFIEKVDDAYDSTYCDIYARISEERKPKANDVF